MYDLIGDIHGHADELVQLLEVLGYRKTEGVYRHPERKVIFLGDFIDRGPKIQQVLSIVRLMIEHKTALAVMGNHELNALAFHTIHMIHLSGHLRPRDNKNIRQHAQTLLQMNDQILAETNEWFRTLPMWLDLEGLRVVHACWDDQAIAMIKSALEMHGGITDSFLHAACEHGNSVFDAVEVILKGKESKLPNGGSFTDPDGNVRHRIRTKWFLSPKETDTYGDYALYSSPIDCGLTLEASLIANATSYPTTAKPVFVGHYWLSGKRPGILAENVACVDYSVAKDGFLCAYRWNGEQKLTNENFVWAKR